MRMFSSLAVGTTLTSIWMSSRLKGIYRYIHWSTGESEYGSYFEKADCALFSKKGSQVSKVVLQSIHNNNILELVVLYAKQSLMYGKLVHACFEYTVIARHPTPSHLTPVGQSSTKPSCSTSSDSRMKNSGNCDDVENMMEDSGIANQHPTTDDDVDDTTIPLLSC
jgi:hypothetical protein